MCKVQRSAVERVDPASDVVGLDAAQPDILPHRATAARQRGRRAARRACPGSIAPSSARSRAPRRRRAWRSRGCAPPARRREATHGGHLVEQAQRGDARQAVGADRDAHAGRVERSIGGVPAPVHALLRGQVTIVAPARGEPASSASVSCTPWTASRCGHEARRSRYSTGPHPGGGHAGFHAPTHLEHLAPRPGRRSRGTRPRRATRRVDADGAPSARARDSARSSAGDTEYGACGDQRRRSRARPGSARRARARRASRPAAPASSTRNPISSRKTTADESAARQRAERHDACWLTSPTSVVPPRAPPRLRLDRGIRSARRHAGVSAISDDAHAGIESRRRHPRRASTTARGACGR